MQLHNVPDPACFAARKMKAKGYDVDAIADITGLSAEEIEKERY